MVHSRNSEGRGGVSIDRRAEPATATATVAITRTAAGNASVHQPPRSRELRASSRSVPRLGLCGGRPNPRKDNVDSCQTAWGSRRTTAIKACGAVAGTRVAHDHVTSTGSRENGGVDVGTLAQTQDLGADDPGHLGPVGQCDRKHDGGNASTEHRDDGRCRATGGGVR